MPFYTAYLPPDDGVSTDFQHRLSEAQVLKDGFSIPAFVFTGLWLLSKTIWLGFLAFAVLYGALIFMNMKLGLSPQALILAQAGLGLFLGLEGHSLWGAKLLAKGWTLAGVVEARNQDEAERRFFEQALAANDAAPQSPALIVPPPAPLARPVLQQVIGMFPEGASR